MVRIEVIDMAGRHTYLSRLFALLLSAALLPGTAALAAEAEPTVSSAAIYTTSNMLGKIYAQDPLTGADVEENYLKIASAMARERESTAGTLLLDAGNAVSTGLTGDDGQATALALRQIGYDALVPGIEELRLGAGYFQSLLQTLDTEKEPGTAVDVLSGNLLDGRGNLIAAPYQVYTLPLGNTDIQVGVLGLGGIDGDQQLPERLYGDKQFAHTSNEERSYVWEWSYWQPQLEQEGCDLVVVVCHADQETLAQFAETTSGIDLLVGGDGPAEANQFLNAEKEPVSYVCGGGTALTKTLITLDENGEPVMSPSALLDLSNEENDAALSQAMAPYIAKIAQKGLQQVGTLSGDWQDNYSLTRQTDTTDLVGEAMLWATGADAALIAPGSLGRYTAASLFGRNKTTAALTLSDCAKIAPDPSPVVTVELTGKQLRQWLEVCADRYSVNEAGQPIGGETSDILYGATYQLYLGSTSGNRVGIMSVQGELLTNSQVYTVAVPAARLTDPEFPACKILWSASADRDFASQGGSTAALLAAYAQDATRQSRMLTPTRSGSWAIYPEARNAALTRLEFVEMLYDQAGRPQPGANYAFIDVSNSNAVIWAAETRVVSGDGKGKFLPLTVVTREQAAVMIYNYVKSLGNPIPQAAGVTDGLLDQAEISSWAKPAVEFCLTTGIIPAAGSREDLYLPASSITRSDAFQYLSNLDAYLK